MKKEEFLKYYWICKDAEKDTKAEFPIPTEMKEGNSWKLMDSTLTAKDIEELEKDFNLTLPEEYKEYIMAASHMFGCLAGNLDNFLFEDDVDVTLKVIPQPYKAELKYIKVYFENLDVLLKAGYIPLGEFEEDGCLYMDLENNNRIVWIPYEDCIGFTKREEFEEEQIKIFNNLSEYMKCFFGKHTHVIEDEE